MEGHLSSFGRAQPNGPSTFRCSTAAEDRPWPKQRDRPFGKLTVSSEVEGRVPPVGLRRFCLGHLCPRSLRTRLASGPDGRLGSLVGQALI